MYSYEKIREADLPCYVQPLTTYFSKDDFSGRAAIFPNASSNVAFDLDLLIQNIDTHIVEHQQIEKHIGETFSSLFFGKAPLLISVAALLPDSPNNYGKSRLIDLYKNTLRISAVARTGVVPALKAKNCIFSGPWVSLRIAESANYEDVITVNFSIAALSITATNNNTTIYLDFAHGSDSIEVKKEEKTTSLEPQVRKGKSRSQKTHYGQ